MNVYLPNLRLPSGYQEVEYIQSSGTQFIDTGVNMNPNWKAEIKYQIVEQKAYATLFSSRNGSIRFSARYGSLSENNIGFQRSKNGSTSFEDYYTTDLRQTDTNVHVVSLSRYVYIDGTLKKTFTEDSSYTGGLTPTLHIFSNYDGTTAFDYGAFKLYYFKILDTNSNLIRDMIPCYRKSDNVIGLYDLVNKQFYTNAGTGTFSKGNDVTMTELKNAYIGDVYDMQIDFRGKTLAQLQALGWAETKYNANCGLSYGADGVQVYRASGNYGVGGVYIQLPRAITANDKITMRFTGVGGSGDTHGRLFVSLADQPTVSLASSTQIETDYSICVGSDNSPQGISCQKSVNGTKTWDVFTLSRDKSGSSGNVAGECILDLPNNKVSWNCTAPSSQVYSMEGTITTDGKNCIIGTNYFIVWAGCYTYSINHKLQTAEIIIES